jgi:UDP-glucose 4-epimerase
MTTEGRRGAVLVTGGAGFIGSHVAEILLQRGHVVVALDDMSGGFEQNVPKRAESIQGSINDCRLLDRLFSTYKFRYVFHLAAYAAEGLSPFIRSFNYQNNLIGSVNLINRAVNYDVERFVFTSSIAVYGPSQSPMLESMVPQPCDPYGISKYCVELDLKCAAELFGLKSTIFRPHNVYGERQNIGDRYRNVVGIFMNQVMQDQPMTIFGDGKQSRAFSYISDVAFPIATCIERQNTIGETFNIGADVPYTVLEIAERINDAFDKELPIQFLPARHEPVHVYADHAKVRKYYPDLSSPVGLDDGIERMASWAKRYGPRQSRVFAGVEISRNMPLTWAELLR